MTISESRRFVLHRALRDQFGASVADTLMEHLPPAGWGDVARQSDIESLRVNLKNEINVLVTEKLNTQLRWVIGLFSAQFIALLAIALR
ncbi:MAG: hypothetical protein KJS66_10470 [Acidobacteria bacterium]|nr:hypothetical protein [Acidobacteriota bacterium]